jgi:hypothetical protein
MRFGIVAVYVIYGGIATAFVFSRDAVRVRISALFKTPCAMKKKPMLVLCKVGPFARPNEAPLAC